MIAKSELDNLASKYETEDFIKDVGTAVNAIEKWSKEHPIITNLQKFEEIFKSGTRGSALTAYTEETA